MQQLATTIGILLACCIAYGTHYLGGTGAGWSDWAWRLSLVVQGVPAVILAAGVWCLPYSPRWLVQVGRLDDARASLGRLRKAPDDPLVQIEFLDIQSECLFEQRLPDVAARWRHNVWVREMTQYQHIEQTPDAFRRVAIASLIMFFQQFSVQVPMTLVQSNSTLSPQQPNITCGVWWG